MSLFLLVLAALVASAGVPTAEAGTSPVRLAVHRSFWSYCSLFPQPPDPNWRCGEWFFDNGDAVWQSGVDTYLKNFGGSSSDTDQDIAVAGDLNGDGYSEYGVFRPYAFDEVSYWGDPPGGHWYFDRGILGKWEGCTIDQCFVGWGEVGDVGVIGDIDGDGLFEIGTYRPSDGTWRFDRGVRGVWEGCGTEWCSANLGASGDQPVVADFNGDGVSDLGVFRPSTGEWYIDMGQKGVWEGCGIDWCRGPLGNGVYNDLAVAGDIDADGKAEIGVYRRHPVAPYTYRWYFDRNDNGTWDGCGSDLCIQDFGGPDDRPVLGRWAP